MDVLEDSPLLAEEVERDREEGAAEEIPQQAVVDGTRTEHPLGTKGTPENGSGEGSVRTGTREVILLLRGTNTGNLRHLIVEDSCTHETGDKGSKHLAAECDPRGDVDVVGKFEILSEVDDMCGCDISISLEKVHSVGITRKPESAK